MTSNCTLTLELGCTSDEDTLALTSTKGCDKYMLFMNERTKEIVNVISAGEYAIHVVRGFRGTNPRPMSSNDTLVLYKPPVGEQKGPEGHVCNIRTVLYGGGHHVVEIKEDKLGDELYPKVMMSIGICRGCGQCYKIAQYSRHGYAKEKMKQCTNQEYADLLRTKFHKMRKMDPDRYAIESFEEARKMLTKQESSKS